jgi:hypothetical protein
MKMLNKVAIKSNNSSSINTNNANEEFTGYKEKEQTPIKKEKYLFSKPKERPVVQLIKALDLSSKIDVQNNGKKYMLLLLK